MRRTALAGLGAVLAASVLVPLSPAPAAAADLSGLAGDGSSRSPYLVADAEDLYAVAEAVNEDAGSYGAQHFQLTAGIDLTDQEDWPGLTTFSGVFDGAGHVISNIVFASNGGQRGFVNTLSGGTVTHLGLDGVTVQAGTDTGDVAGIAVTANNGAVISGNTVTDATFVATSAEKVAGLVAVSDGATVTGNYVDGSFSANKMPAGLVSYAKNASQITDNLVRADLTVRQSGGTNGTRGIDAGFALAYPGTPNTGTFAGNVALGGSIAYTGKVDGFVGRILGYTGYDGWTASDNLANSAITINGQTVTGPGTKNQHGTDTSAAALVRQS